MLFVLKCIQEYWAVIWFAQIAKRSCNATPSFDIHFDLKPVQEKAHNLSGAALPAQDFYGEATNCNILICGRCFKICQMVRGLACQYLLCLLPFCKL